jgi:alkylhydroperoxidase family enzyme
MVRPRIPPVPVDQWPPELIDALPAMTRPGASPLQEAQKVKGALGTLAYHPALAQAWLLFNAQVLRATTLSERHRELLILRVAVLRKSRYGWAEHVLIARKCGVDDEEIARVAYGPEAPFWDPLDATLLGAVDELVADGVVSDETWSLLAQHFQPRQLLDLIFLVGAYETIGWMARSFALDVDVDMRLRPPES